MHENLYNTKGMIAGLYQKYTGDKGTLLSDSEQYAGWTLPHIFPLDTQANNEEFQRDFQSIGARATNHLANKLTLALFAPSRPFFKLEATKGYAAELTENGVDSAAQLAVFSEAEREAMKEMMSRGTRVAMPEAMKLLIVTGNALKYFPTDGNKSQVYSLRDYCVKRDLSGQPLDIITQDHKALTALPQDMQDAVRLDKPELQEDDNVILYTRIRYHEKRYHVYQALNDTPYGEDLGAYKKNLCPWIPMTWNLTRGKDYGSGLVAEYAGDFHALSSLSEAMVIGSAIAADIKFLVDPTGSTDFNALNNAASGSYVPGKVDDIQTLTVDKSADWNMVLQIIQTYEKRLGMAFLLGSAVTRDAERVTAEEIRFQAMELETSLGGVYSRLADDIQQPMAYIFLKDADFNLGSGEEVRPLIITGLDALSRNSEAEALMLFIADLNQVSQLDDQVKMRLDLNYLMATFGAARGVDFQKAIKPEEQVLKEQRAMQEQALQDQQAIDTNKNQGVPR